MYVPRGTFTYVGMYGFLLYLSMYKNQHPYIYIANLSPPFQNFHAKFFGIFLPTFDINVDTVSITSVLKSSTFGGRWCVIFS